MLQTPRAFRLHIGIFGKRNAGKSSLINALTNQELALVSPVPGTTADPVYKSMEILPLGPVVLIDTAGIDDEGDLGELRVKKTLEVLNKTEIAIYVVDSMQCVSSFDKETIEMIKEKNIPIIGVASKLEDNSENSIIKDFENELGIPFIGCSASTGVGINDLKEYLSKINPNTEEKKLVGDLINPLDYVVLVVPIDKAAPKGRLILPQQQVIRDVLDHGGIPIICRDTELDETLKKISEKPRLVITDSQAFESVSKVVDEDIPLTSFSILFARFKGELSILADGANSIEKLKLKSKVLICEGCTHHRQQGDIGRDKIPKWLESISSSELDYDFYSGTSYPESSKIKEYDLIVHCGGCMLNSKEMENRVYRAFEEGVPIVNYGVLISKVFGVLDRALSPFL